MRLTSYGFNQPKRHLRLVMLSLLVGVLLLATLPSFAAPSQCESLFDVTERASIGTIDRGSNQSGDGPPLKLIDPVYLKTMASWNDSWKNSLRNRLINRFFEKSKSPVPADPLSPEFSIEDFQKAREHRSFFEDQNRMIGELKEGPKIVNALIKLLPDGRKAIAAKLLAIREAKHTVDLTYYIFNRDASSQAVMQELLAAVRRGVSVRILYDAAGSDSKVKTYLAALAGEAQRSAGFALGLDGQPTQVRATFEALEFHPIGVSSFLMYGRRFYRSLQNLLSRRLGLPEVDPLPYSWNRRTHDKILLVDGAFPASAVVFTGGRNIGDENYDLSKNMTSNVDIEVMMRSRTPDLEGMPSSVEEAASSDGAVELGTEFQKYYDTLYFHLGNRRVTRALTAELIDPSLRSMTAAHDAVSGEIDLQNEDLDLERELIHEGFSDSQVQIVGTFHNLYRRHVSRKVELSDRKEVLKNGKALIAALESQLALEKEEITIVSPYLWMSERQIRLIKAWLLVDPNRRLTIITNSMISTNNLLAQLLVDSVLGPELMLDRGVTSPEGRVLRRSIAEQVSIYQFGHLDAQSLGGHVPYGNLHMKGIYLKSAKIAILGTYNGDPRSTLLNTEGMVIVKLSQMVNHFALVLENLKSQSHLWGSAEYHAIRAHPALAITRRYLAEHLSFFYQAVMKLNLWWII